MHKHLTGGLDFEIASHSTLRCRCNSQAWPLYLPKNTICHYQQRYKENGMKGSIRQVGCTQLCRQHTDCGKSKKEVKYITST